MGISIHPPHAGRDVNRRIQVQAIVISIHPPHAGRDSIPPGVPNFQCAISIHPPHAGRDGPKAPAKKPKKKFQSTRPMRGGTFPAKPIRID